MICKPGILSTPPKKIDAGGKSLLNFFEHISISSHFDFKKKEISTYVYISSILYFCPDNNLH